VTDMVAPVTVRVTGTTSGLSRTPGAVDVIATELPYVPGVSPAAFTATINWPADVTCGEVVTESHGAPD
jgi:hypothetical protein